MSLVHGKPWRLWQAMITELWFLWEFNQFIYSRS